MCSSDLQLVKLSDLQVKRVYAGRKIVGDPRERVRVKRLMRRLGILFESAAPLDNLKLRLYVGCRLSSFGPEGGR